MSNQRGFAWIDDKEHSDQEDARATALANKWSALHNDAEARQFARQSDMEDGWGGRDGYEPEPCDVCNGDGYVALDGPRTPKGHLVGAWTGCGGGDCPLTLVGIKCPNPNCEDGDDMGPIRETQQRRLEQEAERHLEIEIVEAKLAQAGARMMRPYEHWNEDEAIMQYLEMDR